MYIWLCNSVGKYFYFYYGREFKFDEG